MTRIFIVIPAFNEGKRLDSVIKQIKNLAPNQPIVVVDDGSKVAECPELKPGDILLRHKINLGKGAALKTGIEYAFQHGAEAVVMMDADGQHDPKEIKEFIKKISEGYDLVFGSRKKTIDTPLIRFLGNKFASLYISLLFGIYISDILSGYRAFTKRAYQRILWTSSKYGVETEMVARLGKNRQGLTWTEIPIDTIYIDKYKGVTILDALKILSQSFWWLVS
jgi:glycosyltransferase involved in cell wall biosynthesis